MAQGFGKGLGLGFESVCLRLTIYQSEFRIFEVSGFGISGFGFRGLGFGVRVRVPGFGFRISGFGFRVSGFGFQI